LSLEGAMNLILGQTIFYYDVPVIKISVFSIT